jgi:hypothetical protein
LERSLTTLLVEPDRGKIESLPRFNPLNVQPPSCPSGKRGAHRAIAIEDEHRQR